MAKKEKKIDSRLIYDGHILQLYKDEVLCLNGQKSTREIVRHPGGVCILAMIDNKIIMEKQFRYAYDEEIYELPAGKLEKNEKPYDAALRELEEETGYKACQLESYGTMYPSCGYTDEIIYLYYAKNLIKTKRHLDKDEDIDLCLFSIEEVIEMMQKNVIKDAKTICLLSKYLFDLKDNNKKI